MAPKLSAAELNGEAKAPPAKRLKVVDKAATASAPAPAIGGAAAPPPAPPAPTRPKANASNADWISYYAEIAEYVLKYLKPELKYRCNLNLDRYEQLHHIPPTNIMKNTEPALGGAKLTTHKETWNIERCIRALETTGKYEAAGSLWWFWLMCGKVMFRGESVFEANPHRSTVEAAHEMWTDAAYRASDHQEHRRRFNFPGCIPTACAGLPDAQAKVAGDTPTFHNLPMVAGRACAIAFFESIAECIESNKEGDKFRLHKLFEARGFPHLI